MIYFWLSVIAVLLIVISIIVFLLRFGKKDSYVVTDFKEYRKHEKEIEKNIKSTPDSKKWFKNYFSCFLVLILLLFSSCVRTQRKTIVFPARPSKPVIQDFSEQSLKKIRMYLAKVDLWTLQVEKTLKEGLK